MPKALNYAIQAKRLNSERIMAGLRINLLKNVVTIAYNVFEDHFQSISRLIDSQVRLKRSIFDGIGSRLRNEKLKVNLKSAHEKLENLNRKLSFLTELELKEKLKKLQYKGQLLKNLSYHTTLERGYSVVWIDEQIISSKLNIKKEKDIVIEFKDGRYLLQK
jgi:exodeoxyribonuclease VII large subunit